MQTKVISHATGLIFFLYFAFTRRNFLGLNDFLQRTFFADNSPSKVSPPMTKRRTTVRKGVLQAGLATRPENAYILAFAGIFSSSFFEYVGDCTGNLCWFTAFPTSDRTTVVGVDAVGRIEDEEQRGQDRRD